MKAHQILIAGLFLGLVSFYGGGAFAAEKGVTFQGTLKQANGNVVTDASVIFDGRVLSPSGCVLFAESFGAGRDLSASNGYFHIVIGSGSRNTSAGDKGYSFATVFDNQGSSLSALKCVNSSDVETTNSGTYSASISDVRKFRLRATLSSGEVIFADFNLRSSPFAVSAENSEKLSGKAATDFVNINNGAGVTQGNVESVFSNYSKLNALLSAKIDGSGNYTGNAATATSATTVTGTVAVANGGTGANTASAARTNLGLGTLATISPSGTADSTTYLRGDGVWATVSGGGAVSSVAGRTGAVTLTAADLSDFGTESDARADARITAQKAVANGLASLNGSGKVPATQLALSASDIPALDTSKISTGTFANSMIAGLGIEKLINAATKYFNYKPNGAACADNEVLKYDSTLDSGNGGWKCAADSGVGGETDPTVQAFAKNAPSSGIVVNGSNQLEVDTGTSANKIVKLDGSAKLPAVDGSLLTNVVASSASSFSGSLVGDVSGTQGTTSVDKIKGKTVSPVAYLTGQVLRYDGTNWVNNNLSMFDLRSTVTGAQAFGGAGCLSNQTLTWTAATDNLSCTDILITKSQVSDFPALGTIATENAADYLAKAGNLAGLASNSTARSNLGAAASGANSDVTSMAAVTSISSTGALALNAGGTNQNVTISPSGTGGTILNGNVGVGTSSPSAKLDVVGDMLLSGEIYKASASGTIPSMDGNNYVDIAILTDPYDGKIIVTLDSVMGMGQERIELELHSQGFGWVDKAGHKVQVKRFFHGGATLINGIRIVNSDGIYYLQLMHSMLWFSNTSIVSKLTEGSGISLVTPASSSRSVTETAFLLDHNSNDFDSVSYSIATGKEQIFTINENGGNYSAGVIIGKSHNTFSGKLIVNANPASTLNPTTSVYTERTDGAGDSRWLHYVDGGTPIVEFSRGGALSSGDRLGVLSVNNGNAKIEVQADDASTGTNILFYTRKVSGGERMRIDANGNVGIGTTTPAAKLDVAGEVKFGNTSSTCDSTNEGQQRYNSTSKNMEFCNGTAWTSMTGGGGGVITSSLRIITSTSTYTPTAGTKFVMVQIIGGGGGGWYGTSGNYGGGGGGAGEYASQMFSAATIGASQSITIGAGGTQNVSGGTTSFGALLTALGGSAGTQPNGGSGGSGGSGGGLRFQGASGANGIVQYLAGSYYLFGGNGGSTQFGGGGRGAIGMLDPGQNGSGYGAGGGGAGYWNSTWSANAGAGSAGVVVIQEFQ